MSVLLLEAGGPDSALAAARARRVHEAVPRPLRLELRHGAAAGAREPHGVLAARQDARRLVVAQRDDVGARLRRRLRRVGDDRGRRVVVEGARAVLPPRRAHRGRGARDARQRTARSRSSTSATPGRTPQAFLDAAREAGHPVTVANLPEGQGFSQTMVSQRRGARASTADAYLRPAKRRRNLRVVTGALVRRVTFAAASALGRAGRAARDRRVRRDRRHHPPRARATRGDPLGRRDQHAAAADAERHRTCRAPRRARHPARRRRARRSARTCRTTSSRASRREAHGGTLFTADERSVSSRGT